MDNKKKDVLIISTGDVYPGGIQVILREWLKYSKKKSNYNITWAFAGGVCDPSFEQELIGLGITVILFDVARYRGFIYYPRLARKLKELLSKNSYDVIHINSGLITPMFQIVYFARRYKISTIISHSHSVDFYFDKFSFKHTVKKFFVPFFQCFIYNSSDVCLACSKNAAAWMFGRKKTGRQKVHVVVNAIDLNKYRFDNSARNIIREQFNIDNDELLFGCIGAYTKTKNVMFSLMIFEKILAEHPKSKIWFVGEGEERKCLEEYITSQNLSGKVCLMGARNDVNSLLQAIDCVIFPSKNEGFGIVAIEAQASGTNIFATDVLPEETNISKLIHYLPLNNDVTYWANEIMRCKFFKQDIFSVLENTEYNIFHCDNPIDLYYS